MNVFKPNFTFFLEKECNWNYLIVVNDINLIYKLFLLNKLIFDNIKKKKKKKYLKKKKKKKKKYILNK